MRKRFVLEPKYGVRLQNALDRDGGWTPDLFHRLTEEDIATKIRRVLEGDADIVFREDIRDFPVTPDLDPRGVVWDYPNESVDMNALRDEDQFVGPFSLVAQGKTLGEFAEVFRRLKAANYALFKFLLENQKYIPRGKFWTGKTIYFPGTCFIHGIGLHKVTMNDDIDWTFRHLSCCCLKYDRESAIWTPSRELFAGKIVPEVISKGCLFLK